MTERYVVDVYRVPWHTRRHRLVLWLARRLGVAIVPQALHDLLWDSHARAVADRTEFKYAARATVAAKNQPEPSSEGGR